MRTSVTASPLAPFRIIDLFAGPGGLDVAARQLGIPASGIELDDDACATRSAENLQTEQGDVVNFGPEKFPDANVLAGGPPCQTFTVAGGGAGRRALDQVLAFAERLKAREPLPMLRADLEKLDDKRTGLVLEPLRWALEAIDAERPYRAIVLEQVPAVLPVWQAYERILADEGYLVAPPAVLHTEEYGVPQTRRRAILIARRADGEQLIGAPKMPVGTHQRYRKGVPAAQFDAGRVMGFPGVGEPLPWIAMNQVVRIGQKFEVISNYGTGGDPRARGRRRSDEPSATVTGKISRNRVVSLGSGDKRDRFEDFEAGQLQTFPADYKWSGKAVAQQIGNAVPPRLGMHILAAALDLGRSRLDAAIEHYYG